MTIGRMPASPVDFTEDLVALADYEFRVAQETCIDCGEYHALWGYGRLAGINNGVTTDAEIMQSALAKVTALGARILIAGAADAGLLALTARATHRLSPAIAVADRCDTPLTVCRQYAQSRHFPITTIRADLADEPPAGPYDAILVHNLLLFIAEPLRTRLLRNLGRLLADRGNLVLVNGLPKATPGRRGRPQYRNHAALVEALAAKGIPLPEAEADFRRRLNILTEAWRVRQTIALYRERIEQHLRDAGFRVRERIEHERRRTIPGGSPAEPVPTCAFVASLGE